MKTIKFWFDNARSVSLPQSMMPALVAAFLATKYSDFKWYLALVSIIGIGFAHLSLNLFDDYFDFKNAEQGDRTALVREGFRAMTAKCPPLQDGSVSPKKWFLVSCLFGLIACCFGVPVVILRGPVVLWVVLGVAILGLFYSAPPLKLGYHGLGELIIGTIFGPGIFIGMNLAAAGEFHLSEVLLSCAVGFLVVNILYVHSIMDYAADTKAGKRTLAWLVGCHATIPKDNPKEITPVDADMPETFPGASHDALPTATQADAMPSDATSTAKTPEDISAAQLDAAPAATPSDATSTAAIPKETSDASLDALPTATQADAMPSDASPKTLLTPPQPTKEQIEAGQKRQYITLAVITFIPYVLVILAVALRAVQPYFIVSLMALPWSVDLFRSMLEFKKDPFAPVEKKWWYGSFQMWEAIKENHLDWFMLRWLLAQRISIVFSILCILASIAEMIIKLTSL